MSKRRDIAARQTLRFLREAGDRSELDGVRLAGFRDRGAGRALRSLRGCSREVDATDGDLLDLGVEHGRATCRTLAWGASTFGDYDKPPRKLPYAYESCCWALAVVAHGGCFGYTCCGLWRARGWRTASACAAGGLLRPSWPRRTFALRMWVTSSSPTRALRSCRQTPTPSPTRCSTSRMSELEVGMGARAVDAKFRWYWMACRNRPVRHHASSLLERSRPRGRPRLRQRRAGGCASRRRPGRGARHSHLGPAIRDDPHRRPPGKARMCGPWRRSPSQGGGPQAQRGFQRDGAGRLAVSSSSSSSDGERWGTGKSLPAGQRSIGLVLRTVKTGSPHQHRIIIEKGRAVGVEHPEMGRRQKWRHASSEIVLSCGAIGSPHSLMLSGVGPALDESRPLACRIRS